MIARLPNLRFERGLDGSTALFSADGRHRYMLERQVAHQLEPKGRRLVACGLNPSTADAFKNDPTVRREIGFAAMWGCSIFVKVNAYAWRDTRPADMWNASDREYIKTGSSWEANRLIVGEANDTAIRTALTMLKRDGGIALAAWGAHAKPDRVRELVKIAHEVGVQWMCFGTNKGGSPRHPLYVPNATPLEPWLTAGQRETIREQTRHDVAAAVARHAGLK